MGSAVAGAGVTPADQRWGFCSWFKDADQQRSNELAAA